MANIVRIPISNIHMGGDYTAPIQIGAAGTVVNVILDTGSSALALDGSRYAPNAAGGDQTTRLAQSASYGDNSHWTGAVINTIVTIGTGASAIALPGATVSITYDQSPDMFGTADGILGLAYAPLDEAYTMVGDSWQNKYPTTVVQQGQNSDVTPYLTQLGGQNIASDKIAFCTRRSLIHEGGGDNDPLNQGWAIIGGGEECTDLYTGEFQIVSVLADKWYNTNLKALIVGAQAPIAVSATGATGMPSNSIIDSGTNSLNIGPGLIRAILAQLSPGQKTQLQSAIEGGSVAMTELDLATWPTLGFVMQGDAGDVTLNVAPGDYWQVNAGAVGQALSAITQGQDGLAILGLPLMNGYFTIFDGEADGGRGVVKFATAVR